MRCAGWPTSKTELTQVPFGGSPRVQLIEGDVALDVPAAMSALYADLHTTKYRRSFTLSGELETEGISASLKDGLLTVRIPKRAEFRTRKIKVDVA
jgi:HSP20 family protein